MGVIEEKKEEVSEEKKEETAEEKKEVAEERKEETTVETIEETPDEEEVKEKPVIQKLEEFMFKVGPLGITGSWEQGLVLEVEKDSQADTNGVQPGWQMVKVNDADYSEDILDAAIAGAEPYSITFLPGE